MLIYGVIFTILASAVDYFVSYRLRHSNYRMCEAWNDIYNSSFSSEVVILGNSRARVQYNPQIFDSLLGCNSYNLGMDASPIDRQIIKYDVYCRIHKRPNYLIQNIDILTMDKSSGYEREQFFPYFFSDRKMIEQFDCSEQFNLSEKYLPLYRYISYSTLVMEAFGFSLSHDDFVLTKGYHGLKNNGINYAFAKQDTITYKQNANMINRFEIFLDSISKLGTKVVFVYAPMYKEATEKIVNITGMCEMYDTIAKKRNISILDYNYDPICYDKAYFYDEIHLNQRGSELFSTKLAHDIDSLGIMKSGNNY